MTSLFSLATDLKNKINATEARIGVVGLGYVGLPLSLAIHEAGFRVTGIDIDASRVEAINSGDRVLAYLPTDRIANARASGRYVATTDADRLTDVDVVLVSLPSSIDDNDRPDLSVLTRAVEDLATKVRQGVLVIIESTVYPGATKETFAPIFARAGFDLGQDLFLAFSPEREDPGNGTYRTKNIPKIIGADDRTSLGLGATFYRMVVDEIVEVSSTTTAETVKVYENSFRTVNIALANEMKSVCRALDIDVNEMIAAAATKPFGFMPFFPGPGIGGDCIPVSPVLLSSRAKEIGSELPIVDHAIRSSRSIPAGVVRVTSDVLGGSLAGKSILLLGISYKRDVGDVRRSPALDILDLITADGGRCEYHDPTVPVLSAAKNCQEMRSVELTGAALHGYDAVIVVTDHSDVDYELVKQHAALIVDTRNVFEGSSSNKNTKIIKA